MKNVSKKTRIIIWVAVVGVLLTGLASCGEKGGYIEVTNAYSESADIVISGPYNRAQGYIAAGSTKTFAVDENGSYLVAARFLGLLGGVDSAEVDVSGGATVKVTVMRARK
jgi:hypothetical protein